MAEQLRPESVMVHLPLSLRQQAEQIARMKGVSLNSFIITAMNECMQKLERRKVAREPEPAP